MLPVNDIILTERITVALERLADTIIALERLADTFCPKQEEPCRSWIVFIETSDGTLSSWGYTYRFVADNCDTAEDAIRQVVGYMPRLEESVRIRSAWAARGTNITEFDYVRFRETPQFQVKP